MNVSRKVHPRRRPTRRTHTGKPKGKQRPVMPVVPVPGEQGLGEESRALLGEDPEQRSRKPGPNEEGSIEAP